MTEEPFRWYIMVLDRGFVVVGKARISTELLYHWEWENRCTIRRWGTTQGLSELCNGPTDSTVLDMECTGKTPFRSVLDILHITEEGVHKWTKKLEGR